MSTAPLPSAAPDHGDGQVIIATNGADGSNGDSGDGSAGPGCEAGSDPGVGNGNVEGGSDEWYNFNDASVSKVDAKHIVSPTGYILFYKKRELSSANVINLSM